MTLTKKDQQDPSPADPPAEPDAETPENPNTRDEVTAYAYLGNGERWIEGIPACDLTNAAYRALSKEDRARVRASDLYAKPPQTEAAKE